MLLVIRFSIRHKKSGLNMIKERPKLIHGGGVPEWDGEGLYYYETLFQFVFAKFLIPWYTRPIRNVVLSAAIVSSSVLST